MFLDEKRASLQERNRAEIRRALLASAPHVTKWNIFEKSPAVVDSQMDGVELSKPTLDLRRRE